MNQCILLTIILVIIHTSKLVLSIIMYKCVAYFSFFSLHAWIRASAIPLGFSFFVLFLFHILIRKLDKMSNGDFGDDDDPKTKWRATFEKMQHKDSFEMLLFKRITFWKIPCKIFVFITYFKYPKCISRIYDIILLSIKNIYIRNKM